MTFTKPLPPWGSPRPLLAVGDLIRLPSTKRDDPGSVLVVASVNYSRAHVYPLTPKTRTILVPDRRDPRKKISKEVHETGDAFDISPNSGLERVALDELTEAEFKRLEQYVANGGSFNE